MAQPPHEETLRVVRYRGYSPAEVRLTHDGSVGWRDTPIRPRRDVAAVGSWPAAPARPPPRESGPDDSSESGHARETAPTRATAARGDRRSGDPLYILDPDAATRAARGSRRPELRPSMNER